ncbi:MAG TPA: MraY family glycosyltransferase [Microbacterium sp.]|nr:MraY family glycosyltransferase [Microbacterium sp.]
MHEYVLVLIVAAAVTYLATPFIRSVAVATGAFTAVRERDVHKTPIPRLGGVGMYVGFVAAALVARNLPYLGNLFKDRQILGVIAAGGIVCLVGAFDDIRELDWLTKLAGQILAAGLMAYAGVQLLSLPISGTTILPTPVLVTFTVIVVIASTNAVNFIDGLDGLVAGVCLIANGIFFVYSYLLVRDTGASSYFNLASFIAAVLIGVCLGFLPLNWSPAKLFMGDSGALVLGLLMATSAIAITGQIDPAIIDQPDRLGRSQLLSAFVPILLPVVIVLLPLLDFGLAVIRRMGAGKSPFSPDRKHLHHRMLDMGHTDRGAVLVFYAWTAIVGFSMLLMYVFSVYVTPGDYWPGIVFGVAGVIACLVVTFLPTARRRRAPAASAPTLETHR